MQILKKIGNYLIILVIGILVGFLINLPSCNGEGSKIEYVPVHDTITVDKERIVEHTKVVSTKDTIVQVVLVSDTLLDSVFVSLPMENKEYLDTLTNDSSEAILDIKYHGVYTSIDSVSLNYRYYKERETVIQKPRKWGVDVTVGPYIGYGASVVNQQFKPGFQIGIGVSLGLSYRITK